MKIFISQPMYGKTEEQIRNERKKLVPELEAKGHLVEDTVFTEDYLTQGRPSDANPFIWALGKSLEVLSQADAVIFMKGWEQARGCVIEHDVAVKYNKFVKELN